MKIVKKTLEQSQVELTVELSLEETQPFVDKAAKRIAHEVNIKGFRKGKVPYEILKQQVGEQVIYEEAFADIVEDSLQKALKKENLNIAARPKIDREKLAPGNPVVYKAVLALMPTVVLGEYKNLKSRKGTVVLDQKKYEKTLADLRKMRAKEKLVVRTAKKGDKVLIDFVVKVDGVAIEHGSAQKQHLVLGESQMIPGFEDNVVGMKQNEEKDFEVTFPKDYKKELANKKAKVHVKVHGVYELELPELDDNLAKELNFESLKKLEEEIRQNIEREIKQEVEQKFAENIIDELIAMSKFDALPPQLIAEETDKMLHEIEHEVGKQGLKFEDYLTHLKKTKEELRQDFNPKAQDRIKAALVLRAIAQAEDIKATVVEVDKEINDTKKVYEKMPNNAEIIKQIDSLAFRIQLENQIIHRKIFEKLEEFTKK
ncbi:MAG: trigger factor [Candidatus Kerfeldbacteria bacterium RIFOXYA2_FULL_38_24]|uniref:Trigger factor n=1 Tax=Candidatus Kerfeldbacteria bacterium RIFOXYB2_FULL_38_14 TaxID=1798547 RepID=A0A1G2BE11_9BACT|nr:MAG: trigger factor [Candidatus Kerfeldbacteria bacterium RIFOXYA2_FULL_38_24]OGY87384.1 MAG: trigger factor [Candidatus Kerfeldbacteria bacterium RIFOXYB2_FULL_38_14]OGY90337.1 MAG: trigger factor [Candidatus Kerfeldbacteria bacterium RIFOXYC2_FULL_38_9]